MCIWLSHAQNCKLLSAKQVVRQNVEQATMKTKRKKGQE